MLLSGSNRRAYSLRISAGLDPKMQNANGFAIQKLLLVDVLIIARNKIGPGRFWRQGRGDLDWLL